MTNHTEMSMIERLKLAIEGSGLSMAAVARACDIPYRTLQNYLLEKRVPPGDVLQVICNKMDINANWLFSGFGNIKRAAIHDPGSDTLNRLLLEKIIQYLELNETVGVLYISPYDKSIAISAIYAELSDFIKRHPQDAARMIGHKDGFKEVVNLYFMRQFSWIRTIMSEVRMKADEWKNEEEFEGLEIIPEEKRHKPTPQEEEDNKTIAELMRDVDEGIRRRAEQEREGKYVSPFEPSPERASSRTKKGRTSNKGRT